MKTEQPIAFIFVIVSPKVGFHKCALWCEYDADRIRAYDKVRQKHVDMFVYSSIPVYDKNSIEWDYYVRFIRSVDGEIVRGLRFLNRDPFWVGVELGRDREAEIECYLSKFAVLVHYETNGKEYVSVFDWLDADVESVRGNVKNYLPKGVKLYAIFSGVLPSWLCNDFMKKKEDVLFVNEMKFIRNCVLKAEREIDFAIMLYNGAGYSDCEKFLFDDSDCSFIEECNDVRECLFKRNLDGIL